MTDIPGSTPPGPPLTPADIEELLAAILDGYRDRDDLVRRVHFKWGIRLGDVIDLEGPNRKVAYRLLEWTQEEGRTRELLGLLWSGKPGNPNLVRIGTRLLGPLAPIAARYELQPTDAPAAPAVTSEALEKVVTDRSPLVPFADVLTRLNQIGDAVCRVETPFELGTGFLVGRQTVLTNYHVVKSVVDTGTSGSEIACRFDFVSAPGEEGEGGTVFNAATIDWLRASSPYSESDLTGEGEPLNGELDFALIRLAAPVEESRLALAISGKQPIVAPMDIAIIVQHPNGDPLKLAMGQVVEFPASGMRYRYNATTKGGSSGAPVLSADFQLIALHHAADPKRSPRFNQAVPIWRIAAEIAPGGPQPTEL